MNSAIQREIPRRGREEGERGCSFLIFQSAGDSCAALSLHRVYHVFYRVLHVAQESCVLGDVARAGGP